ncbi:MAG: hypothetical protein AVDCRST_MAG85-1497, partial [uncultured Solirubrobacteraceae bacterium]
GPSFTALRDHGRRLDGVRRDGRRGRVD